ncbi:MAG: GSCFA domain protein [Marinilabiliales bacterium]|nr:MAG: GSCFA domain protein [Marinilabiliales bacterium]
MKLITKIEVTKFDFSISHNTLIGFTGSCFAENIGNKLDNLKFKVQVNPLGINYNPLSLGQSIKRIINQNLITENDLFLANDLWNSYDFHSKFSSKNKDEAIEKINDAVLNSHQFLKSADYLFISFGTSYVYKLKSGNIVSNCNKQADNNFERILLTTEEIVEFWLQLLKEIKEFNPKLKLVFTISPIRHKRDGFIANQLSKSILFVAVNQLKSKFDNVYYFPSYEIMMDELRDYRFYKEDMIHPSELAVDYILERFGDTFFGDETKEINKKISKILAALNHRPFNTDLSNYKEHLENVLHDIEDLERQYPYLKLNAEKKQIEPS